MNVIEHVLEKQLVNEWLVLVYAIPIPLHTKL